MKPILKQIVSNYDLLFGEQTKLSFTFREASKEWFQGVTKPEIREQVKKLNKKEKNPNKLIKKVQKIYPAVALIVIIGIILALLNKSQIEVDKQIEPDQFDEVLDKKEIEKVEREREIDFKQPSSFIGRVTYTIDLQTMELDLGGRVYGYCNVPMRIYTSFEGAPSKGEFYNRSIKGQFNC